MFPHTVFFPQKNGINPKEMKHTCEQNMASQNKKKNSPFYLNITEKEELK